MILERSLILDQFSQMQPRFHSSKICSTAEGFIWVPIHHLRNILLSLMTKSVLSWENAGRMWVINCMDLFNFKFIWRLLYLNLISLGGIDRFSRHWMPSLLKNHSQCIWPPIKENSVHRLLWVGLDWLYPLHHLRKSFNRSRLFYRGQCRWISKHG